MIRTLVSAPALSHPTSRPLFALVGLLFAISSILATSKSRADTVGGQTITSNWDNYGNYTFINDRWSGVDNWATVNNYGTLNFQGDFQIGVYNNSYGGVQQKSGMLQVDGTLAIGRYSGSSGYLGVTGGSVYDWYQPIVVGGEWVQGGS